MPHVVVVCVCSAKIMLWQDSISSTVLYYLPLTQLLFLLRRPCYLELTATTHD